MEYEIGQTSRDGTRILIKPKSRDHDSVWVDARTVTDGQLTIIPNFPRMMDKITPAQYATAIHNRAASQNRHGRNTPGAFVMTVEKRK